MANEITLDQQEVNLESMANPTTPAAFLLALQNPHTRVFKDMVNLMMECEDVHLVVDALLNRLALHQFIVTEKEKRVLRSEMMMQAVIVAEQVALNNALLNQPQKESLVIGVSDCALSLQIAARAVVIQALQTDIGVITDKLNVIRQQDMAEWKGAITAQINDYARALQDSGIKLVIANDAGTGLDANQQAARDKAIITKAFEAPSPLQVLETVASSWQKLMSHENTGQAKSPKMFSPPPPPLPPGFDDAKRMAGHANVMKEIRLIKALCGGSESIAEFIKAKDDNKAARNLLPGVDVGFKPAEGKKADQKEDEQTKPFAKAMERYAASGGLRLKLQHQFQELVHQQTLQEADIVAERENASLFKR